MLLRPNVSQSNTLDRRDRIAATDRIVVAVAVALDCRSGFLNTVKILVGKAALKKPFELLRYLLVNADTGAARTVEMFPR